MKAPDNARLPTAAMTDRGRSAEIDYHKGLNRSVAIAATPVFVFFAFYWWRGGYYFQTLVFSLMSINAVVALLLGVRITDLKMQVRLKLISAGIAFGLLAVSLLAGLLSRNHFHIFFPWIFCYPIAAMLFFGQRIGLLCALLFCWAMVIALLTVPAPPLDSEGLWAFRLNAVLALLMMLTIALIAERYRVRVQRKLIAAQNEYRQAEQRQREANLELQAEIERRARSETALMQSEARYRALFEESTVSLWEEDWSALKAHLDRLPAKAHDDLLAYCRTHPEALKSTYGMVTVTAVNRATLKLFEADSAETMVAQRADILPREVSGFLTERLAALYHTGRHHGEVNGRTLGGRPLHLMASSTVAAGFEASWEKVFTSVYDITERVAIEQEKIRMAEQMQHGRQFEAIATLAGGIAHQFNNALAVIGGNLDLLEIKARVLAEDQHHWEALRASAGRMGRLTDQLLAYAKGGKYKPRRFSVNDLIRDILAGDKVTIDSTIRVIAELAPDLHATTGDTTQITMVLESVMANAVEAMPQGGLLRIVTANQRVEADPSLQPGDYAVVLIEDSGAGMDAATLARIFEPFYTTKLYGRGLGMAAAYGIVRNHDGTIAVSSVAHQGTQVTVCLPVNHGLDSRPSSIQ